MKLLKLVFLAAVFAPYFLIDACSKNWTREDYDALSNKTFTVSRVELTVDAEYGYKSVVEKLVNKDRFRLFFQVPMFASRLERNLGIEIDGADLTASDAGFYERHSTVGKESFAIGWTNFTSNPNRVEFVILADLKDSATFYFWINIYAAGSGGRERKIDTFKLTLPMYDEAYTMKIDDEQWYQLLGNLPNMVYRDGRRRIYLDGGPADR